ncbi:aspartate dehydrogenase domain-containing protein [Ancylobacter terrae]|uniref:aspartate dehydrogenase domain-containing protein n=1 Tax=Ancylobacter sp. sgz301288 TaxID=3342077 RepID=UPI00385E6A2A
MRFPRNSNVAAAVALAGIGFDATTVEVIADPSETRNVIEVHAAGRFGELHLVMRNQPSPVHPRTAMIPPMSVLAALRRRQAACVVPA